MTMLNLLQQSNLPSTGTRWISAFLLPVLLVVLGLVNGWQARGEARLGEELRRLQEQSQELARRAQTARQREKARAELAARRGLIDKLEQRRRLARKQLTAVAEEVAEGTWLVELSLSPTQISFRGMSNSGEHVSALLARLEAHPELGRVHVLEVSRTTPRGPQQAPMFAFTARTQLSATPSGRDDEEGDPTASPDPSA